MVIRNRDHALHEYFRECHFDVANDGVIDFKRGPRRRMVFPWPPAGLRGPGSRALQKLCYTILPEVEHPLFVGSSSKSHPGACLTVPCGCGSALLTVSGYRFVDPCLHGSQRICSFRKSRDSRRTACTEISSTQPNVFA